MKIGLVSEEFVNENISHNISVIKKCVVKSKIDNIDMLLFGESFLQGFDSLSWKYKADLKVAFDKNSAEINELKNIAIENNIILGVGYFEKFNNKIFDSYLIIDNLGNEIINYKRISEGWKIKNADKKYYCQGDNFPVFNIKNIIFSIGLCGDFWHDENLEKIRSIKKDYVIWPVYVNYSIEEWNNEKNEYGKKAKEISENVFFINSINKLPSECFGGAVYFKNGNIIKELEMGKNGILIIEI